MKKIIIWCFMFFSSLGGYAQLPPEDFEDTWAPIPAAGATASDWLTLDNGIGPVFTWVQAANSVITPSYENVPGSHAAYLQRENVASGFAADYLVTPEFVLTANARLLFQSRLTQPGIQGSIYKIMILPQGGNPAAIEDYIEIVNWDEEGINPNQLIYTQKTVAFPQQYENTTVRIAFVMEGDNADRWLIDQVMVITPCDAPVGLPTIPGPSSAEVSWTDPGGAVSWQMVVQLPINGEPTVSGTPVTGNTGFTVTQTFAGMPLAALTVYEYYVRAVCTNGGFSAWAGPYAFTTGSCAASQQCSYTFIRDSQVGSWVGAAMEIRQNGTTVATIENGPVGTSETIALCDGIPFEVFWSVGGGFFEAVGLTVKNNFGQVIFNLPFDTEVPGAVIFEHLIDCSTPGCIVPSGLNASNITTTGATLSWEDSGADGWQYFITHAGGPLPSAAGAIPVDNAFVTVGSLDIASNYEFYVRMVCENGTSAWAGPFLFGTSACDAEDKCDYTFKMLNQTFADWEGATITITQNGSNVAVISAASPNQVNQAVTIPLCNGIPFEVAWTDGGQFPWSVGLVILNSFEQPVFTLDFNNDGLVGAVLFSADANCATPECIAPTGLAVSGQATNSATLSWDGPATGAWQYYITGEGSPAPVAATAPTAATSTSTVTVEGLAPSTSFEYYVRIVCGADGTSDWAGPFAFQTEGCAPEDKCIFTFEMSTTAIGATNDGYQDNTMTISQLGVPVATIGEGFTSGVFSSVDIALCPDQEIEIFWNNGGNLPYTKALRVLTPFDEELFFKPAGTGLQGTVLFTGITSCAPPPCPKPQNINVTDVNLTTVALSWTEMGLATSWEVVVVPVGAPAPAEGATGEIVTVMPYIPVLEPGKAYQFFIRAICGGENGKSGWTRPFYFTTAISNDECSGAISVPVNAGIDCTQSVSGTFTTATISGFASCSIFPLPEFDVWYTFVAEGPEHIIRLTNFLNTSGGFVVYKNDCGNLAEVQCSSLWEDLITGLTPGQTYFIRAWAFPTLQPGVATSFDICIGTPLRVVIDNTQHTVPELVSEVLVDGLCAQVSNITWKSGLVPGGAGGIAMFGKGNSNFGVDEGIVLSTHLDVTDIPGPKSGDLFNTLTEFWPGDADLFNYINGLGIDFGLTQHLMPPCWSSTLYH